MSSRYSRAPLPRVQVKYAMVLVRLEPGSGLERVALVAAKLGALVLVGAATVFVAVGRIEGVLVLVAAGIAVLVAVDAGMAVLVAVAEGDAPPATILVPSLTTEKSV